MQKAYLKLKDGTIFSGILHGNSIVCGEVVFNTSMTGYPEILTDPSYNGQIVVMTYPLIGNYGVDICEHESSGIKATALIVKKLYRGPLPSGKLSLEEFMLKSNKPILEGIDTRALTLHIRDNGSQNGVIYSQGMEEEADKILSAFPSITQRDLISEVAVNKIQASPILSYGFVEPPKNPTLKAAVVDYGIKYSIIDDLYQRNCDVTLFPPTFKAEDVLDKGYDLLFLSNGPGDPALLSQTVEEIKKCLKRIPIRGICLGHQLLTLALGGKTVKMDFGHHGGNQPVKDMLTGKTFVTSQNHGFMSDESSLPKEVLIWMRNANDNSVEGIISKENNVKSVQFHPEASPGPHDKNDIFDEFLKEL